MDLLNSHPCASNAAEVPISLNAINQSHTIALNTKKFASITECIQLGNTPTFGLKNHATDLLKKTGLNIETLGQLLQRYNTSVILYMRRNLLEEFISFRNLGKKLPLHCPDNSQKLSIRRRNQAKCDPKYINDVVKHSNVSIKELEAHIHRRMDEEVTWVKQMEYLKQKYNIKGIHSVILPTHRNTHSYSLSIICAVRAIIRQF